MLRAASKGWWVMQGTCSFSQATLRAAPPDLTLIYANSFFVPHFHLLIAYYLLFFCYVPSKCLSIHSMFYSFSSFLWSPQIDQQEREKEKECVEVTHARRTSSTRVPADPMASIRRSCIPTASQIKSCY